ncbi:MAG: S1 RNA-binding domain-containing protein [Chloroflexi bacterium]|nr:S1 RNA-binding domain-containing protein [Chloroflexota bacterium]
MSSVPLEDIQTSPTRVQNLKTEEIARTQTKLSPGEIRQGTIIRITNEAIFVDAGTPQDIIVPRKDFITLDDEFLDGLAPGDQINIYIKHIPEGGANPIASMSKGIKDEAWKNAEIQLHSGKPIDLKIVDQNRGGLIAAFGQLRGFLPNSHIPELKSDSQSEQAIEFKRRKVGTTLSLLVVEADKERNRLILSAKTGRDDQLSQCLGDLKIGETITGQVVNLVKFGAFVDLGSGINGLVHISELSWQRIKRPSEVVSIGDEVTVQIKAIDLERKRISLSRKALQPNPWDTIEDRYKVGNLVEGVVTTVRGFGVFIELAAGVEGLLHQSEFSGDSLINLHDSNKPGDKLLVRITNIQPDQQRIGLSLQQVSLDEQLSWMMHKNDNQ